MYNTKALVNSSLEVLPRGHLEFRSSWYIFLPPTPFFGVDRGKKAFQALTDV
jgi:hypothetical protein